MALMAPYVACGLSCCGTIGRYRYDLHMLEIADALPLEDARWNTLAHRAGVGPVEEMNIAAELQSLLHDPLNIERAQELWPYLASEGSTWTAAYAALPYLVQILTLQPAELRAELLSAIGIVLTGADESAVPKDLLPGYRAALDAVYLPLGEALCTLSAADLPWVLATISALRGNRELAEVLQEPESLEATCEECGAEVSVDIPGLAE